MMKIHALVLSLACCLSAIAQEARWIGTWAAAPQTPWESAQLLEGKTVREIVHTSVGGTKLRLRISNRYGDSPLQIAAAHVAVRSQGSEIRSGTDHPISFSGRASVWIPIGADWISDEVSMQIQDTADLAVSFYFEKPTFVLTQHNGALHGNFVALGDQTSAERLSGEVEEIGASPFLSGIEVVPADARGGIVTLGDSITDGSAAQGASNHRWPDLLAARLLESKKRYGVMNLGISANRLLRDGAPNVRYGPGANAVVRIENDLLARAGVTHVIVLEGVNDLGHPGSSQPLSETVTAEDLESAYTQMTRLAQEHGIKIYIGTILPFEGTTYPGYYSTAKEQVRQSVNRWIRESRLFDGVIDFDAALRDPSHPARMLPEYDSGDHLHPNDRGTQAMADAVPLSFF
ncbi:MAG: SGNH/GDSL hydrolase family protein [Acidobacteriales bacterium]|nr:SGNH/GDSL hydrolase family protein [Terriglobales bacterium]